ncbi:MAG: methionyl-tRNA formyltransferase [Planctomycetaceae bacterium]|nr:methionyl-tRNA formyltransferase [Planctomycetaceae bacterium]
MRIAFLGSAQFGIPSLEAIAESRHELVGVFTQPARPAGRHRDPKPTDVAVWCSQRKIAYAEADNINDISMKEKVSGCLADLLVVIAFGQKIGQDVIALQRHGAVNVHASLLPEYRGAAPIHWAIMNGQKETGVSIITLAEKMDAGFVLGQARTPLGPEDTFETVHDRLSQIAVAALIEAIDQIEAGTAVYSPQDQSRVSYAPRLRKEHGYIDWERPAERIVNQVRGLWPWPGAQSVYVSIKTGKHWRVTVKKAAAVSYDNARGLPAGTLNEAMNVVCGHGALKILELKPAGSDLMTFEAFTNGRPCSQGDLFISAQKAMTGLL